MTVSGDQPSEQDPDDSRPSVRPPWAGPPTALVITLFCLLGMGLVLAVQMHRQAPPPNRSVANQPPAGMVEPPATPVLDIPPAPPPPPPPPPVPPVIRYVERPAPPPIIQYVDRPQPPRPPPGSNFGARLSEPVLAIDLATAGEGTGAQPADEAPAEAVVLHNRSMLVPQGSLIPAVIETAIDSSELGPVRAVTTGDTRGFDGTRVLIPRGSRLVGEIRAGTQANQDRVTIVWTRIVRPDGIAIRLTAPSVDSQGGSGVEGRVDNHIAARVGSAVLQSALTVGVALASRPGNGSVVLGLPAQNATGIVQAAAPQAQNAPTITVRAGAPIMIFVTRDLDFSGALPKR